LTHAHHLTTLPAQQTNVVGAFMTPLEEEFDDAVMRAVRAGEKMGYSAARFLEMRAQHGPIETARRLMNGKQVPYGVFKLKELRRLDLSIEAIVHDNPKFQVLFPKKTLDDCRARLVKIGYIREP